MLFYFHFFYSFPFNVISVATVLCFCGFHPPVVSTFLWFPPFCGFHPVWLLCGLHPPVVCIFPWLLHGVPSWFALLWFTLCCGFHRGLHLHMVPTLPVVTPWCSFRGSHFHGLHSAMVSTPPWFASLRGSRPPPVVTPWCPFCGLHHHMVYTLPWFPPSHGLHLCVVVTLPVVTLCGVPFVVCTITWFTLCCGFHPPVVCIFTWFPPSRGNSVVSILDFGLN